MSRGFINAFLAYLIKEKIDERYIVCFVLHVKGSFDLEGYKAKWISHSFENLSSFL